MKKLFIIGNGFDLSLGLKTKYEDFVFWFISKELNRLCSDKRPQASIENELFSLKFKVSSLNFEQIMDGVDNLDKLIYRMSEFRERIEFNVKNSHGLFQRIYANSSKKWVDIEYEYYNFLKLYANLITLASEKSGPNNDHHTRSLENSNPFIKKLNNELKALGEHLMDYLKEITASPIESNVLQKHLSKFSSSSEMTYFLNFNYTNTLKSVLKDFKGEYQINHIHGSIDKENIIFGYGDEMDKSYKAIEELNDNTFFEHIKSFQYFKQANYSNLLSFILSDGKYEVCIYGHSCGLSDRVMLNEIFEHKNCQSIKVYYYKEEEYTTKTMDISRHFDSNQLMRQRVMPFSKEDRIPQVGDSITDSHM